MSPKISAVMALYNTPFEYLEQTVKSILNQTFNDFEFIIVDDASSVEYEKFFNDLNDNRINYIKLEKNGGPGNARNLGIKKATGEYVAIVDSDDVYMPTRFEKQSDFLNNNPQISLISGGFRFSNNGREPKVIEQSDDIKVAMLFNSQLANPLIMFRRDVFFQNNLFYPTDINFAEDYQLWINAMFKGINIANIPEILMTYTRHKNQLSKTKVETQTSILRAIYKNMLQEMGIIASESDLDLHSNINAERYEQLDAGAVSKWFDLIISKNNKIFNPQKLQEYKQNILLNLNNYKNRIFKIKIGQKNLCIYKPFKIKLEKRA